MSIGLSGMRAAETRFATAASRITSAGVPSAEGAPAADDVDMASEMVDMTLASYDFKASAKVVQVGREMMKSTLDILA